MKRSVQEIVELLVFGLIALLIGTGLLWLVGWIFDLAGVLFKFFAALIWSLLRFIVPVAVGAAIVYALVRLVQQQREKSATEKSSSAAEPKTTLTTLPAETTPTTSPAAPDTTADTYTPPPPAPAVDYTAEKPPEEGESQPTASEVWAPPQPSPPTEPDQSGQETAPLGPKPTVEQTAGQSSVPAADDEPLAGGETPLEEMLEEGDWPDDDTSVDDGDGRDDDEHRS